MQEGVALKETLTRAVRLFSALDQAGNTEPVGRLDRDDIYNRPTLR